MRGKCLGILLLVCLMAGCGARGSTEATQLRLNNLGPYRESDLREAAAAIKEEFRRNDLYVDCVLDMLYFDWFMSREFAAEIPAREGQGETLVFSSDIIVCGSGSPRFPKGETVRQWLWYLSRDADGTWRVTEQGYSRAPEQGYSRAPELEYLFP